MNISLPPITDPVYNLDKKLSAMDRFFVQFIRDERDLPFIYLMLQLLFIFIPMGIYQFIPGNFTWWLVLVSAILQLAFYAGPFNLMLHNTSHRKFFKQEYDWANQIIPWVIGPFLGQSPETYFGHHIGMHHAENNMEDDLSSTLHYQRDSFLDFMKYFTLFLFSGFVTLVEYHRRRNKKRYLKMVLRGELTFMIVCAILLVINWRAALVVFVLPFVINRFLMMAGNWGQHAFIDLSDPENNYKNSLTCINARYNKICFNDGYHIGHHLKPNMHWTDMPVEFQQNIEKYVSNRAVIFEGIDFFFVWFLLMTKSYKTLASHFVDAGHQFKNQDEIIAFIQSRLQKAELAVAV
jgi:fatty acid desaturase